MEIPSLALGYSVKHSSSNCGEKLIEWHVMRAHLPILVVHRRIDLQIVQDPLKVSQASNPVLSIPSSPLAFQRVCAHKNV